MVRDHIMRHRHKDHKKVLSEVGFFSVKVTLKKWFFKSRRFFFGRCEEQKNEVDLLIFSLA